MLIHHPTPEMAIQQAGENLVNNIDSIDRHMNLILLQSCDTWVTSILALRTFQFKSV